jgi:D-cysteine desulfhydrase
LTRAARLEQALGAPAIWVKRDDLTGFATAGTKARALEFLIADARASGAERVVVTGSPSSNFCAVAALAARAAGLGCDVLYCGAPPTPRPLTVRLATAAGARVCFEPSLGRDELDATVIAHAEELTSSGTRAYPVPRGGATAVGALGGAYAVRELAAQCAEQDLHPAVVVALVVGISSNRCSIGSSLSAPATVVSRPKNLAFTTKVSTHSATSSSL